MKTFRKFRSMIQELQAACDPQNRREGAKEALHGAELGEDEGVVVPANNVGDGNIAGAGIGPQGEPGVPVRKKLKLMNGPPTDPRMFSNKIFKRK